jgi:hypothetical protein
MKAVFAIVLAAGAVAAVLASASPAVEASSGHSSLFVAQAMGGKVSAVEAEAAEHESSERAVVLGTERLQSPGNICGLVVGYDYAGCSGGYEYISCGLGTCCNTQGAGVGPWRPGGRAIPRVGRESGGAWPARSPAQHITKAATIQLVVVSRRFWFMAKTESVIDGNRPDEPNRCARRVA